MFALSNISRFEDERGTCKILKPIWDVITDYLLVFLVVLSIAFGGMQVTSGSFECLAAVHCSNISTSNMNSSSFSYHNVCEVYYISRKTDIIRGADVVSDLKSSIQYAKFVNSECSKIAVPDFLSYFGFVLFIQAFVLIVLDNLWLKLPITASVIENFVALVMECYASPCPNFALTHALSDLPPKRQAEDQQQHGNNLEMQSLSCSNENDGNNDSDSDELSDFSVLEDSATINAVKTLYEKVDTLKKNVKSSRKIWQLYLLQAILQAGCAVLFLVFDIYFMSDLKGTMTCKPSQHIRVAHDYFICSHNLAPAFVLGLTRLYLPALVIIMGVYIFIIGWILYRKGKNTFQYSFDEKRLPSLVGIMLSDIPSVNQDFGFLLHLLHSYNKLYVVRFAHFLSKKSKKKIQAFELSNKFPVPALETLLKTSGKKLTFTDIQGIPETIFKLATKIVALELRECRLQCEDFDKFSELTSLRNLSINNCRLKSIPTGILKMKYLEVLNLNGNLITSVNQSISSLQNLTTLDLSHNKLEIIESGSLEELPNVLKVYLSGNSKLQMAALKVVLACERLRILHSPRHLVERKDELNPLEREKFDAVNVAGPGSFVIPYTPEDASHIDLNDTKKMYKMDSCPKGIAIIINNYSYVNTALPNRNGSQKDVAALKKLFEDIGFDTYRCLDQTSKKAKEFVEKYAKEPKYKDCDCIAVFVSSHGDEEGLIFPDDEKLSVKELVECVEQSLFYEGKPKLFFIQACRGKEIAVGLDNFRPAAVVLSSLPKRLDDFADGVLYPGNLKGNTEAGAQSVHVMAQPFLPQGADILLSYSTMYGYSAFRNVEFGTWFVHYLVETFCEHAWEEDILSLLTLVNYKVVRNFTQAGWRQVPAPQSTLRKKLYLLPGYPRQSKTSTPKNTYV